MEPTQDESPGLTPERYEELIQFLVTWSALTPDEAEARLRGDLHPGQSAGSVARTAHPPVRRRIYPPGASRSVRS